MTALQSAASRARATGRRYCLAESHEAAAKTFENHPHLQIPQASIELMEIHSLPRMYAAWVAPLVSRCEEAGWVVRRVNRDDLRVVEIRLTASRRNYAASGTTALAISFPIARSATSRSYCACRLIQNSGVVPNRRARRSAISADTAESPRHIKSMRRCGTLVFFATR